MTALLPVTAVRECPADGWEPDPPRALSPRRPGDGALAAIAVVLAGYALDGRGFAYIGIPPVFVGELALACGLVALWRSRGWVPLLGLVPASALVPFSLWGAAQTLPYLRGSGASALRDAAVWGYGAFAWVVAGLIVAEPSRLARLIGWYRGLVPVLVAGLPVVAGVYRFLGPSLPRWPWGGGSGVPVVFLKEGDALVHFSAVLAFWVSGFGGRVGWGWVALLAFDVALLGVVDRAGMLSFAAVLGACLVLWPRSRVTWRFVGLSVFAAWALWVTGLRVEVPGGKGRSVSFEQILTNLSSMTGDIGNDGLDSTKEWRLQWWQEIVGYTLHGPHFWAGKGFGVNLADDDGFQVNADHSLRSPHNVHMTVLARAGVPGLLLWAFAQSAWVVAVFRGFLASRAAGDRDWLGMFLFLGSFWSACMINASFDVFLEGPVGGVWFWAVYGVGLAAVWAHRNCPEAVRAAAPAAPASGFHEDLMSHSHVDLWAPPGVGPSPLTPTDGHA